MPDPLALIAAAMPDLDLAGAEVTAISHGGSDRSYHRVGLGDGSSWIVMLYTDVRPDNLKFAAATETLQRLGVRVPDIVHDDPDAHALVLQDLGSKHLWDIRGAPFKERSRFYKKALDEVDKLHQTRSEDLGDEEQAALEPPFDEELYGWELDYFFEEFLARFSRRSPTYVNSLRDDPSLVEHVDELAGGTRTLVHRDFQSQNVLIHGGEVYLIDYQGLRLGQPEYDIASLIYDPYVEFSPIERGELVRYAMRDRKPEGWLPFFHRCAAQRLMQALGAYGKLGKGLGKSEFLAYIPNALHNLRTVLEEGDLLPRLAPYLDGAALSLPPLDNR